MTPTQCGRVRVVTDEPALQGDAAKIGAGVTRGFSKRCRVRRPDKLTTRAATYEAKGLARAI